MGEQSPSEEEIRMSELESEVVRLTHEVVRLTHERDKALEALEGAVCGHSILCGCATCVYLGEHAYPPRVG